MVAKQIVNGLADLLYNKPSLMMHYSKQFFEILVQDHHQHMRLHVTQMVIKLVLSGVLRFKEGVGKLIFLLVDTDAQVRLFPRCFLSLWSCCWFRNCASCSLIEDLLCCTVEY